MTIPREYTVATPFGEITGTCRQIVDKYNAIVRERNIDSKHCLAISSFSRLVTGRNKSGRYKMVSMAKPWKRRAKMHFE